MFNSLYSVQRSEHIVPIFNHTAHNAGDSPNTQRFLNPLIGEVYVIYLVHIGRNVKVKNFEGLGFLNCAL